MPVQTAPATVAEMTPAELRAMIEEVVHDQLSDLIADPDEGFELRPEFVERLRREQAAIAAGDRGVSLAEVLARRAAAGR